MVALSTRALLIGLALALTAGLSAQEKKSPYPIIDVFTGDSTSHSRSAEWKPGDGIVMEVGGMDFLPDGRLAVSLRRGEIWFLGNLDANDPAKVSYHRFAHGLHEPLGVLVDGKDLLVTQRTEVTRLRDLDGDDIADEYLSDASGWHVSGNYHGYAYGPERDGAGNLWVALNVDMGDKAANDKGWRGWGLTYRPGSDLVPMAAGMRSPSGLGTDAFGEMFFTDQEGTYIPATPIHHLRKGVFYGNAEGIASQNLPGSPFTLSAKIPARVPYPKAVAELPELVPPACWLPYNKMGRSATDLELIDCDGKFGPFDGQFLVGEFTNAAINRVFLEKIDGEYQGACFPFRSGFASAVFRLKFDQSGQLYVGLTNRGWSSLGARSYGLQKVRWNGETEFQILHMKALSDGFELAFTEPVDPTTAGNPKSYTMESYTYQYGPSYGGEPIQKKKLTIRKAIVAKDGRSVRLQVDGLRTIHVHELRAEGLRSAKGEALGYPDAYYTLNRIPKK